MCHELLSQFIMFIYLIQNSLKSYFLFILFIFLFFICTCLNCNCCGIRVRSCVFFSERKLSASVSVSADISADTDTEMSVSAMSRHFGIGRNFGLSGHRNFGRQKQLFKGKKWLQHKNRRNFFQILFKDRIWRFYSCHLSSSYYLSP